MKIKLIKSQSFVRMRVLILIMKAFIFLLCATVFGIPTEKSFSQEKISIEVDKVVSVDEVFDIIQDQTKYRFLYPADLFTNAPKVQLKKGEIGVDELLKQSLSHSAVEFELSQKNRIVIRERNLNDEPAEVIQQQQFEVSGVVYDEDGGPLPGASIVEMGTLNGTQTDFDGNFSLAVANENAVLKVSYIGFASKEISINGQENLTVILDVDASGLEEVVVVGYGTQKRRDLTGAVASISTQDIVRANPVQAAAALQGQVTGVNINKIKGRPGDGFTIDIRGLSSFGDSESSAPLVVIDGVVGGDINAINPNDIAAMDVLKDASSTAIYGSRGANGVIIITTKKGVSGKPKVTYRNYTGIKVPTHLPDMMNAQQFYNKNYVLRPEETGRKPRNITDSELANVQNGRTVDWVDLITGAALQNSHDISLSGGSDRTTYDFSAGYLNEEGNTLETGFKRYTIKGGIQSTLNDKLKVGMSTYYTYSKQNLAGTESLRSAYRARPTGTVYYDDLLPQDQAQDKDWNGYAVFMGINDNQVIHPSVEIDPENTVLETLRSSILANAYIDFTPVKGLSLRSSLSAAVSNQKAGDYRGTFTKSQKTTLLPKSDLQTTDISSYTLDNNLQFKFGFP